MSDDKSDKAGGWFSNPLPIVMVVLLAAGVLVKNVPLESARPTDPERVKFIAPSQQDVEARLWQDPFAAVERHKKNSDQAITPEEETSPTSHLPEALCKNIKKRQDEGTIVTVIAVSVFGGSYAEAAESRRRSRFAVDSALDFHHYHPENAEALGYFRIDLPESQSTANTFNLTVPYEWFETRGKSSAVLVLWLNEDKLSSDPLTKLHTLFNKLTPNELGVSCKGLTVKLIGPAGSAMLRDLVRESTDRNQKTPALVNGRTIKMYSPSATISNCNLIGAEDNGGGLGSWDCFKSPSSLLDNNAFQIIRTTGTDDVLAAALLWELWQRGVNHTLADKHQCADGIVLIGERDTEYGRTLLEYLRDGFSKRCGATTPPPVRTFNYLRGLDGVLPDIDNSGSKAPQKDDRSRSKDLRAQLDDTPPEHAEGRSQFDYLRRLADEIDRLDRGKEFFAENGVKAIGLVGSDLYDKLLILQALRSRFKGKIFFTTDLDARYLHTDQKDWARNLVVASNFGLSLRPALQRSTLPFRDSYQTATYLATLMALKEPAFDWTFGMENWLRPGLQQSTQPVLDSYLTATQLPPPAAPKVPRLTGPMGVWLSPKIFEIGRTETVHLASPSVKDLIDWIDSDYSKGSAPRAKDVKCDGNWTECENIEPDWPPRSLSLEHLSKILIMLCLGIFLVALANRRVNETVRAAFAAPSPKRDAARKILYVVIGAVVLVFMILWIVWTYMDESLTQGIGEPFVWFEGVSVWPSLVVRFVCLVTMLSLWYAFLKMMQQKEKPDKDFEIPLPKIRKLNRSKMSAWLKGPHLNLALFDKEGNAETNSAVEEESAEKKIIDVTTLWQNYLRATSCGEMAGWIGVSLLIGGILSLAAFNVLDRPSFPHRGDLVKILHVLLVFFNAVVLWVIIFWVGYETRACAQFIETLSNARSLWSTVRLDREEASTGVPRAHLDDYLDFQLIVRATQRIHWLIYLPFVSILFMVLARSNFFDAMDFPLSLVFVIGLALGYSLHSAKLLRKSAEAARAKAIEHYERRLLTQTRAKDSLPSGIIDDATVDQSRSPISVEQIKLLMERIRNNREGAFAPFAQQPALQALLLPFGGYGSVQIIEYLFKL